MQRPQVFKQYSHSNIVGLRRVFSSFSARPTRSYCSEFVVCNVYRMFARHTLRGLRILVSCASDLRSRCPSSQLPWSCEGQRIQSTMPFVFPHFEMPASLAMSEHPRRTGCSAVVLPHHRGGTPCNTTCGNDTLARYFKPTSSISYPARATFTRWLHIAWFCSGATSELHNSVSRRKTFLEVVKLCREYVSLRQYGMSGKYMHNASSGQVAVTCRAMFQLKSSIDPFLAIQQTNGV